MNTNLKAILTFLLLAGSTLAGETLYERKATLVETMIATRARYVTWLADQKIARAAVQCGPWFVAGSERPGWKDGTLFTISDDSTKKTATLSQVT